MNKNRVFLWLFSLLALAGCGQKNQETSSSEIETGSTALLSNTAEFKAEYEALNDAEHPNMIVPENLDIHTLDFSGTQALLNSWSGVLYFGFPTCPWCRNLLPELFTAMEKSGISTLYYFNPKELRDEKELVNWEIIVKKPTTPEYQRLLDKLDAILPAYDGLNDPNIKRLYVPTVVVIKEGKILNHHLDTLPEQEDPMIPLTADQKLKLQLLLQDALAPLANETCTIPTDGARPSC